MVTRTQIVASSERRAGQALQAHGLHVSFGGRAVLDQLDLSLHSGESVAVIGPSGSGKSTLLMLLAGISQPDQGEVVVGGRALARMSDRKRAALRLTEVGVVYQFGELLPELTPVENVALPALLAGRGRRTAFAEAERLLVELGVSLTPEPPTGALSGGERQRVAVARALVNQPSLLLADEPTGSLDRAHTDVVADLLFGLPRAHDCALVVVSHDRQVAARADRVTELEGGRLVEVGA